MSSDVVEKDLENDEKVHAAIESMKGFLSEGAKANFRDFWRTRKTCLELFKAEMHPLKRSYLWDEYTKLLSEAHRLQKILDEQVEFQTEQIALAIKGLEKDFQEREEKRLKIKIPLFNGIERKEEFSNLQATISFLNVLKEKTLALREEVLSLEMRVGQKNKILEEIQKLGNDVFPECKKLLDEASEIVLQELEQFLDEYFDKARKELKREAKPFEVKKRIKEFQEDLKNSEISKEAYRKIRKVLNGCWNNLESSLEKRKEEFSKRSSDEEGKLQKYLDKVEAIPLNSQMYEKGREILFEVKKENFLRENFQKIKDAILKREELFEDGENVKQEAIKKADEEKREEQSGRVKSLLEEIEAAIEKSPRLKLETIQTEIVKGEEFLKRASELELRMRLEFKHNLLKLKKIAIRKAEKNDNDQTLERKTFQEDQKEFLEILRKELRLAGLDIQYAIDLQEMLNEGKEKV